MTDKEKARRACHWLKTYVLGGKASIGEEANGIRRSYSVEDSVLDEIRCLCDEFARMDTQPILEPEPGSRFHPDSPVFFTESINAPSVDMEPEKEVPEERKPKIAPKKPRRK